MPMDPLSITLAVITLATALKDIVETAEIIQDSFSKLPQNYRDAKRLAEEVLETLRGMEEIYQEHEQTFNKTKLLRKAIKKLQVEMKSAHEQCICLIPPVSERKRDRFKTACYSFWRRSKVERLLSELKDHVDRCSQQFHLLSSFQSDALIIEMHNNFVQSASHGSAMVHSNSTLGSTSTLYDGLGHRTNSQQYAFTRMTDTIPVHELSKAYLRREIGRVNLFLRSILAQWSQNPPPDLKIHTWGLIISLPHQLSPSVTVIHQDAVVAAFRLQSLLQGSQSNQWINDVYYMLRDLTVSLSDLEMYEDCIPIETSAVTFWRSIAKWYPSLTSFRYLAKALKELANSFSNAGNTHQAYSMREEAIDIISLMAAHKPIMELDKQDIQFIAENRILQAENELSDRSLRLALDGHNMFEGAFKLRFTELQSGTICFAPNVPLPFSGQVVLTSSLDIELENQEISDNDWYTYASSLLSIARIHDRLKLSGSSHKLATLSLKIFNHLLAKHSGSRILQLRLDCTLSLLLKTTNSQYDAENLEDIQQHVVILRRLTPTNPRFYVERLAYALWSQREVLLTLGRPAEADSAYEAIISLKDLATAPAHSDLQIPSEIEAEYYAQLAEYHYQAQRFSDSINAAQNAISQYTALEFMDPGRSRAKHISVLVPLCQSLSATHQYEKVLSEGYKAIKMIESANIHDPEFDFVEVLHFIMKALEASSHPEALAQAVDLNTHIGKLVRSRELKLRKKLAPTLLQYANLLQRKGRVEKAVIFLREMLDDWQEKFGDLNNTTAMELHIRCLLDLSQTHDEHGNLEKALRYKEEARFLIVGHMW